MVTKMDRLTVNSVSHDERYTLKCMCKLSNFGLPEWEYNCRDYCDLNADDCEYCGIREAFDRLAAYEDTGLTPEEITTLIADNENLHRLVDAAQKILWSSDTEEQE